MWISMVFGDASRSSVRTALLSFQVLFVSSMSVSRRWWWVLWWVLGRARRPRRARRLWLLPQVSELRELADWRLAARAARVRRASRVRQSDPRSAAGYAGRSCLWTTLFELKRARGNIRPFRPSGFFWDTPCGGVVAASAAGL